MCRTDESSFFFSVVTAAYNVEPWIGSFLQSLKAQSLDYKQYIQLIVVDDGSTDGTGTVAANWTAEHPENTIYIRQKNEGAASARNRGLHCAQGDWVTFCDADDFVCDTYFDTVKTFLESGFDGLLAACNPIFFHEQTNSFSDTHPLRFKFRNGNIVVDLDQHPEYVQLFCNSAFFRREALQNSGLRFDGRVRPSFEDGHLLNKFLLLAGSRKIAFLQDALYFYRKRAQGDGLVDSGWARPEKYREQIVHGYLDLVRFAKQKTDRVPPFIQQAVIYDTQFYMDRFLLRTVPRPFSSQEFADFLDIMRFLFAHIERDQVLFSPLPMLAMRSRIAMLKVFKGERVPILPLIVSKIAAAQKELWASACTAEKTRFHFQSGQETQNPLKRKTIPYRFCGILLCVEHYFHLSLKDGLSLSCTVDGQTVGFRHNGEFFNTFSVSNLSQGN